MAAADEEVDQLADDEDELPAPKVLSLGDTLPDVTLKNEKDEDVKISQLVAEKGLVLFLVPKADTRQSYSQPVERVFMKYSGVLNFILVFWHFSWLHETGLWFPRLIS